MLIDHSFSQHRTASFSLDDLRLILIVIVLFFMFVSSVSLLVKQFSHRARSLAPCDPTRCHVNNKLRDSLRIFLVLLVEVKSK